MNFKRKLFYFSFAVSLSLVLSPVSVYAQGDYMGGSGTRGKGPGSGPAERQGGSGPETWSEERQAAHFPGETSPATMNAVDAASAGRDPMGAAPSQLYPGAFDSADAKPNLNSNVSSGVKPLKERLQEVKAKALEKKPNSITRQFQTQVQPDGAIRGPSVGGKNYKYVPSKDGPGQWKAA